MYLVHNFHILLRDIFMTMAIKMDGPEYDVCPNLLEMVFSNSQVMLDVLIFLYIGMSYNKTIFFIQF